MTDDTLTPAAAAHATARNVRSTRYRSGPGAWTAVWLLLAVSCGDGSEDPATSDTTECERVVAGFVPELRETPCSVPTAATGQTTCGVLRMAEDSRIESCALDIAFARYEPELVDPEDPPIFLLGGGPGQPLLEHMQKLIALGDAVAPGRVLVAHDARGSGLSTPTLDCLDVNLRAHVTEATSWIGACADHLAQQGHRAERYRTPVLADDVIALADALGMPLIDVFGASYGSRLAHVVAATHSDRVRAVVLDAATPLDAPLFERMAGNLQQAWQRVVDDCGAQSACSEAHGDLQADLETVFATLATAPVHLASEETALGPELFASVLSGMLTTQTLIPAVPAVVTAIADGNVAPLETIIPALTRTAPAFYMHYAIMCSEELPHNDRERAVSDLTAFPELASELPYDDLRDTCDALGLTAAADLSDMPPITQPTLALTGRYDTLSPASNWDDVEHRLPHGTRWDIGDAGHGGRKTPCGEATIAAFLAAPLQTAWPTCLEEVQAATFIADWQSVELPDAP